MNILTSIEFLNHLIKLADSYKRDGLEVLGQNTDHYTLKQKEDRVEKMLELTAKINTLNEVIEKFEELEKEEESEERISKLN